MLLASEGDGRREFRRHLVRRREIVKMPRTAPAAQEGVARLDELLLRVSRRRRARSLVQPAAAVAERTLLAVLEEHQLPPANAHVAADREDDRQREHGHDDRHNDLHLFENRIRRVGVVEAVGEGGRNRAARHRPRRHSIDVDLAAGVVRCRHLDLVPGRRTQARNLQAIRKYGIYI